MCMCMCMEGYQGTMCMCMCMEGHQGTMCMCHQVTMCTTGALLWGLHLHAPAERAKESLRL